MTELEACQERIAELEAELAQEQEARMLSARIADLERKRAEQAEAERDKLREALQGFVNMTTPFTAVNGEKEFRIWERDYQPVHDQAQAALEPSADGGE